MKAAAGQSKILCKIKIKNPFHLLENTLGFNSYRHFAQSAKLKA
jgi:hypothetical protein